MKKDNQQKYKFDEKYNKPVPKESDWQKIKQNPRFQVGVAVLLSTLAFAILFVITYKLGLFHLF